MKQHPVIGDDLCRTVRLVEDGASESSATTTSGDGRGYPMASPAKTSRCWRAS